MNQPSPWIREPRQIPPHIRYTHSLGRGMLTFEQVDELVKAINQLYVAQKNKMSYLSQHQARAEMNRIFGYGNWDVIEGEPTLMYEYQEQGTGNNASKMYWVTGYRGVVTVNVRDLWGMPIATYTGTHAEENVKLPNRGEAHAMAITSLESYALRRALINLGDRFGLGLYNGGSVAPHGQYTMQLEPGVLFDWKDTGQVQQAPTEAPRQPTHETIAAERSVDEGWAEQAAFVAPETGGNTAEAALAEMAGPPQSYVLQQPPIARAPEAERFPAAIQQVQQMNEAARDQAAAGAYPAPPQQMGGPAPSIQPGASDALKSRMQQQMKVDRG